MPDFFTTLAFALALSFLFASAPLDLIPNAYSPENDRAAALVQQRGLAYLALSYAGIYLLMRAGQGTPLPTEFWSLAPFFSAFTFAAFVFIARLTRLNLVHLAYGAAVVIVIVLNLGYPTEPLVQVLAVVVCMVIPISLAVILMMYVRVLFDGLPQGEETP